MCYCLCPRNITPEEERNPERRKGEGKRKEIQVSSSLTLEDIWDQKATV